jgi:hypothetical protein
MKPLEEQNLKIKKPEDNILIICSQMMVHDLK